MTFLPLTTIIPLYQVSYHSCSEVTLHLEVENQLYSDLKQGLAPSENVETTQGETYIWNWWQNKVPRFHFGDCHF